MKLLRWYFNTFLLRITWMKHLRLPNDSFFHTTLLAQSMMHSKDTHHSRTLHYLGQITHHTFTSPSTKRHTTAENMHTKHFLHEFGGSRAHDERQIPGRPCTLGGQDQKPLPPQIWRFVATNYFSMSLKLPHHFTTHFRFKQFLYTVDDLVNSM